MSHIYENPVETVSLVPRILLLWANFTNKPGNCERARDERNVSLQPVFTALANYLKIIPLNYTPVERTRKYDESDKKNWNMHLRPSY